MKNNIKAVIFDMDGVISDTLDIHCRAESEILSGYGINISIKQIPERYNGVPDTEMFKDIFEKANKTENIQEVYDKKWKLMEKLLKNNIRAIPGAIPLINILRENNFLLGVASSTPIEFIEQVVKTLDIKEKFYALTSTYEVKHGKPNPDIFLLAAKKLGTKPQECVVIEDATSGIQAAKNAGMKCIAITTTHKKEDLAQADKIIDNFSELTISLINSL